MKIRIIERYLAKEIVQTFLAVLLVLLLIFVGRYFARYLAWAAEGFISSSIVIEMLALRTISAFNIILPFGLYLAVLLAFGRLYKDNEMTALQASGVGVTQVMRVVFKVSFMFAILVGALSLYISPWAFEKSIQIQEKAEASSELEGIAAGQFNEISSNEDFVFYAESFSENRRTMNNIFVQHRVGEELEIFSAVKGYRYQDPDTKVPYLMLTDGVRYKGTAGKSDFQIQYYKKSAVRIETREINEKQRAQRAISTERLLKSEQLRDQAELMARLGLPIATILLALLAVFLSHTSPRQGRFAKLFVSIVVFIIHSNLSSVSRSWVEQGVVHPMLGMWWLHLVLVVILFVLYKQREAGARSILKSRIKFSNA